MRSLSYPDGLTLTDSPGCFWFLGGFFCTIGGAVILAAISSKVESHPTGQILLATGFGLAAIAAGIYLIYNAPASRVVISKTRNVLTVSHRGLLRRQMQSYGLTSIQSVYILKGKDVDGDPVFTIRFRLADGRELPLTHLWLHNRAKVEVTIARLSEYLPCGEMKEA